MNEETKQTSERSAVESSDLLAQNEMLRDQLGQNTAPLEIEIYKLRNIEKDFNDLKNYISNHVLDEIYNQHGGNTDMIEELRSFIG